jgi:LemA protein
MKKALLIFIAIIVVGGLLIFNYIRTTYDQAVQLQETVDQKWGDVGASYQRRADLVPNLVATVSGAAEVEKEILTRVTEARAGIVRAQNPEEMELMGRQINTAINLAFEAYPQIRSTEGFRDLQAQLEGTENRINVARQNYNESVRDYNSHVRGFIRRMVLGDEFEKREPFRETAGSEIAPEVKF